MLIIALPVIVYGEAHNFLAMHIAGQNRDTIFVDIVYTIAYDLARNDTHMPRP
jgi:hypothetical protein